MRLESAVAAETGLDYFGARYFSGAQGRFTTPDAPFADQHPEDPQSWNLYSYARNNPLRYVDVDGAAVVDAGRVQIGSASFHVFRRQGTVDVAAMLVTAWPVQHAPLNQFGGGQSPIWYPTQVSWEDNQLGGCVAGCLSTFNAVPVGINLNVSFNYDQKTDALTGANIGWSMDSTASFIGSARPATARGNRGQQPITQFL